MYGDPTIKAFNSAKWVPPGYITRKQRDDQHFRQRSVSGAPGLNAEVEKTQSDGSVDATVQHRV